MSLNRVSTAAPPGEIIREWIARCGPKDARPLIANLTAYALETTGRGVDLTGADLAGLDLSGCDFRQATFNRAQLYGTKFVGADLSGATLICPGLERADFRRVNLTGAYVHALAAQVCKFDDAILTNLLDGTGSLFHGCSMTGVTLVGARLAGATFYQCDLTGSAWSFAQLQGTTINECTLSRAGFTGADVAQVTITKCLMHGVSFAHANGAGLVIQRPTGADGLVLEDANLPQLRLVNVIAAHLRADGLMAELLDATRCVFMGASLNGAHLTGARLVECMIENASLLHTGLVECQIRRSSFARSVLAGVQAENGVILESSFRDTDMRTFSGRTVTFRDCDLTNARLTEAYLYRAILTGDPPAAMSLVGADLDGANLVQAYVAADCSGANLRNAKCAYARLNQSSFEYANLAGAGLYETSLVKTKFTGATLTGIRPPFFADRCPGLEDALELGGAADAKRCVEATKAITQIGAAGST